MPLHPAVVHLPLALSFILPAIVLVFAWAIHAGKMSKQMWFVVIGLQVLVTTTGYIALETGETDEDKVAAITGKDIIHEHEESAEIFVGMTVISLAAGIAAWFLKPEFQDKARFALVLISLLPVIFGWQTGSMGGEIVYKHGGASAHADVREVFRPVPQDLSQPVDPENESLKLDENDYEGAENYIEDDTRIED